MNYTKQEWWERFRKYYTEFPSIGLAIDLSRIDMDDAFFATMEAQVQKAFTDMNALENGAIANPDEKRMVGHYWLRTPELAPTPEIRVEIETTIAKIKEFADKIHSREIIGEGGYFKNYLLIGIGGSALGPQFVAHALSNPCLDKIKPFFFDNTDSEGMKRVLATIGKELGQTLCIVISKSGGTKETRNGMITAKAAYEENGLQFEKHAVAITMMDSKLDVISSKNGWLYRLPMWDWVGGRTSELSAVGLLPAALQGFDISEILMGAKLCDQLTRTKTVKENPAIQLSLAWYKSGGGVGTKNMVILPYKDCLELFSKYLQQLVMESLGKELNLSGQTVNQGLTVFGNKGSTDQHSYVQQLREGPNDYFATFIEVLHDNDERLSTVEPNVSSGDYLLGFLLGTRQALTEKKRESITITISDVSSKSIGILIALFERAVGYYASLINVNPYNQPGVEAGKKASANVIHIQNKIFNLLNRTSNSLTCGEIAEKIGDVSNVELVFKICEHLAANNRIKKESAKSFFQRKYRFNP